MRVFWPTGLGFLACGMTVSLPPSKFSQNSVGPTVWLGSPELNGLDDREIHNTSLQKNLVHDVHEIDI